MKKQLQNFILNWLKLATKIQLQKNKPTIIGVTGSAGKTSTVRAIDEVLKTKFIVKSTLTGNSETGVPFEVLNIPLKNWNKLGWAYVLLLSCWRLASDWEKYELLILEMGIDSDQTPKNMDYLLSIVQPQIGVFLNVNHVHGQNFSGKNVIRAIANEKGKLLTSLPISGLAIFSKDHLEINNLTKKIKAKKQSFSTQQRAQMQLLKYQVSLTGTEFVFLHHGQQLKLSFSKQLLLKESFGSFATALLIGKHLGVEIDQGIAALENKFKALAGRSRVIPGINASTIIDSSYNSSLEPTKASLEMMRDISIRGKKIAILGDMREIGKKEKQDHEQLAVAAAKTADQIILIGPLTTKYTLPKLKNLKFPKTKTHSFKTAHQAITTAQKIIQPHDLILVKGSQNTIFLEVIVKAIMAQPHQASKILCRQSRYWEQQRHLLQS